MAVLYSKYANMFRSKALQNVHKFGTFGMKKTPSGNDACPERKNLRRAILPAHKL
jgi:hypothetical protein